MNNNHSFRKLGKGLLILSFILLSISLGLAWLMILSFCSLGIYIIEPKNFDQQSFEKKGVRVMSDHEKERRYERYYS